MFLVWLILGLITISMGMFSRQIAERLGSKPNSEIFTNSRRKHSSKIIEQIGRCLAVTLGVSFLVLGFGEALPVSISQMILFVLSGLAGLMLCAMIVLTVANWKAR
jgi:hypothetical protein